MFDAYIVIQNRDALYKMYRGKNSRSNRGFIVIATYDEKQFRQAKDTFQ